MTRRILVIAGEASGDLHGSGVVRELKLRAPGIEVFGMGGDMLRKEGMEVLVDFRTMAFMGFVEVAQNLRTVLKTERILKDALDARKPDAVLLIDYPGFNLRFARRARSAGAAVHYYISPQVWAWHRSRVKTIARVVDKMHVIFPFEEDIYAQAGVPVMFVGHPLVERLTLLPSVPDWKREHGFDPGKPLLGLFPGSRVQEVERILPAMVDAARLLSGKRSLEVGLGLAPNLGSDVVRKELVRAPAIRVVEHATRELMQAADAAIVTSGTATLEIGWYGTPFVVVYRTSPVTYAIGRALVDVDNIGLVNIVAGRRIVPELIQHACTSERMVRDVEPLLFDTEEQKRVREGLSVIREKLGGPGASRKVAESILAYRGAV
ncbi:MAG: lipid-A-disaccharide synthase [Bacteroidetes bacterium]|nr:lipid-A-disaccharide synthase [Bacteroidota bacterium]